MGFTQTVDANETGRLLEDLGRSVTALAQTAAEAQRERLIPFTREPDPSPLARTLQRLKNDLVMLRRATAAPLPDAIARRLGPPLDLINESVGVFLRGAPGALAERTLPPPLEPVEASLEAFGSEIAALRAQGLTPKASRTRFRPLSSSAFSPSALRSTSCVKTCRISRSARVSSPAGRSAACGAAIERPSLSNGLTGRRHPLRKPWSRRIGNRPRREQDRSEVPRGMTHGP